MAFYFVIFARLVNICINTNMLGYSNVKSGFGNKSLFAAYFTEDYERLCTCKAVEIDHYKNKVDHTSGTENSVMVLTVLMIVVLVFVIALHMLMGGKGESQSVTFQNPHYCLFRTSS